ncbi:hypothetical protein [Aureimonas sp. D3]|uniref:hypothetical protein n=1 Tax=Aureimonas sp. D3 TaxID=1638164 RepID=UPI000A4D3A12|nr:hypothetical protein [Aureimonas sp. D3]
MRQRMPNSFMKRYMVTPPSSISQAGGAVNTSKSFLPVANKASREDEHGIGKQTMHYVRSRLDDAIRPNSERGIKYSALYEAIRRMADLPPGNEFHIDRASAEKAEQLLAVLHGNFNLPAPKLFPQDGDSVVLTWSVGDFKRLLTVAGSEIDLMDYNKKTNVRCDHELEFNDSNDLRAWLIALAGAPAVSSNGTSANAAER